MGRYYSGDIEGKFWVAVQSSADADFFGVEGHSNYLSYYFDKDNLEDIKKGVAKCKKALGKHKKILDDFFAKNNGWNDDMITTYYKDNHNMVVKGYTKIKTLLEWYARLHLGEQIQKCVEDTGECAFEAEL